MTIHFNSLTYGQSDFVSLWLKYELLSKLHHSRVTCHVSPCDALDTDTRRPAAPSAGLPGTEWVNFTRFNEI